MPRYKRIAILTGAGLSAESGIATLASAGGKSLAVSSNGVLTWDTSATTVGQLYAVQVYAIDNHPLAPSGTGTTRSVVACFSARWMRPSIRCDPPRASRGRPRRSFCRDASNAELRHPAGTVLPACI